MFSAQCKTRLATALAGAAIASALVASGASADLHAIDSAARAADAQAEVPPPASSIAGSAAEEYQDLRSPDAVDAARAAGDPPEPTQDLRAPDTRDAAEGYAPTLDPQPVATEPSEPSGFDLMSAVIGAIAAGGLSLLLIATLGMRRRPASA